MLSVPEEAAFAGSLSFPLPDAREFRFAMNASASATVCGITRPRVGETARVWIGVMTVSSSRSYWKADFSSMVWDMTEVFGVVLEGALRFLRLDSVGASMVNGLWS